MSSAASPVRNVEDDGAASASKASQPQMLVLIGSDGGRAMVSHAIASEASYLLRDLLDGQGLSTEESGGTVRVSWDDLGTAAGGGSFGSGSAGGVNGGGGGGGGAGHNSRAGVSHSRDADSQSNSSDASEREITTGKLLVVKPGHATGRDAHPAGVRTGTVVGVKSSNTTSVTAPAIDLDAELFAAPGTAPAPPKPTSTAVPDLMDFFAPAPDPSQDSHDTDATGSKGAAATAGPNNDDDAWDDFLHVAKPGPAAKTTGEPGAKPAGLPRQTQSPTSRDGVVESTAAVPARPAVLELPFPYFRGDILERVCTHMAYRYRTSTFGTENGEVRVFCTHPREVPKPMTMPLAEYLDSEDRQFVSEWDETLTLEMLKAATLLNYDALYQLASAKLASFMVEKTVDGIRAMLGVEGDFDATEEAELKKEQVIELPRQ